jgi:dimethylargininase
MNFTHAIVCTPCKNIIYGITTASLGKSNYLNALVQHQEYIKLLKKLGLDVTELSPDDDYPDSTFVEDTAVLLPPCAIVANPGVKSRRGEIDTVEKLLKREFSEIEKIVEPGTLEGGDILEAENHFYIGISERTNQTGADQLLDILSKYGKTGSIVPVNKGLHLKSTVSYLGQNHVVIDPESINGNDFKGSTIITTESGEGCAANSISVNGTVILPDGFPKTRDKVEKAEFSVRTIEVSEFRKLDGGLSCLSLRY